MAYSVTREKAQEIRELVEDTVEYFCDENMVSGELAWLMIGVLADAKVRQLKGEID